MVQERLSRLGPRLQAGGARAGLSRTRTDFCRLATEQRERSQNCHRGFAGRRSQSDRRATRRRDLRRRPFPLSLRRGWRVGPLTEAIASRTTVVEGRLIRLSQRDHRTALSTNHSSIGLERVPGQRRRSQWRVRPGQCLALPDLLSHELSRGQATGMYQRSSRLRSMAHPKWLIAISFNLHTLHIIDGAIRFYPVFESWLFGSRGCFVVMARNSDSAQAISRLPSHPFPCAASNPQPDLVRSCRGRNISRWDARNTNR